ncbi:hypothetical protein VSR34_08215 [Paraburkholderia sp. JHI2823]|uniref:hypothetical protein n=1 Tax=Paraburkholderia TaxID=1822464 RepID=UPI0012B5122A|nr:hypothetical protein [Paraburkholderia mimosarum]
MSVDDRPPEFRAVSNGGFDSQVLFWSDVTNNTHNRQRYALITDFGAPAIANLTDYSAARGKAVMRRK